jgi:hypothetical protein
LLAGYFDDSGTHPGSPVVVVAGAIGSTDQWDAFDAKCDRLFSAPLPGKRAIREFHLVDCQNGNGEFEGYTRAESDALTHDFRQLIIDAGIYSIAFAVDGEAWSELVTGPHRIWLGSAEQQCFISCIDRALTWARSLPGSDHRIALMFDEGRRTDTLEQIVELYRRRTAMHPEPVSIDFGRVADFRPLQAADYVSTETNWYAREWFKLKDKAKARAHFASYMKNAFGGEGNYMDRQILASNLRRTQILTMRPDGRGLIQMPPLPSKRE